MHDIAYAAILKSTPPSHSFPAFAIVAPHNHGKGFRADQRQRATQAARFFPPDAVIQTAEGMRPVDPERLRLAAKQRQIREWSLAGVDVAAGRIEENIFHLMGSCMGRSEQRYIDNVEQLRLLPVLVARLGSGKLLARTLTHGPYPIAVTARKHLFSRKARSARFERVGQTNDPFHSTASGRSATITALVPP